MTGAWCLQLQLACVLSVMMASCEGSMVPCGIHLPDNCLCHNPDRQTISCIALARLPQLMLLTTNIHTLILTNSTIPTLSNNTFGGQRNLRRVIFYNSRLSHIESGAFRGIEKTLKFLDLSNNCLVQIPPNIKELKRVRTLDLSYNEITVVRSDVFAHIETLRTLLLHGNPIAELGQQPPNDHYATFDTPTLKSVSISVAFPNYKIKTFPSTFDIEELVITNTQLNLLDSQWFFDKHKNLIRLSMINCGFYDTDSNLENLRLFVLRDILRYINLANNRLELRTAGIGQFFQQLVSLNELDLSFNNVTLIGIHEKYMYDQMESLTRISLKGNQLRHLDMVAFRQLDDLNFLDLRDNYLQNITAGGYIPTYHPKLKMFLSGNPWNCDCNLLWLKDMIHAQLADQANFLDLAEIYTNLMCKTPRSLAGKLIKDIQRTSFVCGRASENTH